MRAERLLQLYDRVSEAPDAIPKLRRFILDLAVRGKLVEQDPEDEPASELLKRIALHKQELVQAGEAKAQKHLPAATRQDLSFDIPSTWEPARLADVAVCLDYMRRPINGSERAKRIEGKSETELYPYYGATQQQGWIDDYIFDHELVLLGEDGVPFFDPMRTKAYLISGKSWVNNHAHVFKGLLISSPFLAQYLNVFDYTGRVVGATRSKLNQARAIDIPVPLPPRAEQHRIVAKVDELMALCDSLEAEREKREATRDRLTMASLSRLTAPDVDEKKFKAHADFAIKVLPELTTRPDQIKALRQTILDLAVRGRLVEQDPNDEPAEMLVHSIADVKNRAIAEKRLKRGTPSPPVDPRELAFPLPDRWALSRLGAVFDVRDGTHDTPKYVDDGVPLVTSKNLSSGTLSLDGVKLISVQDHHNISARSHVEKGDVLFAMIGSIGNPVIVDIDCEFSIKNVALFKYYDPKLASPRFLRYFLMHAAGEMKTRAVGGLQPFVSLGFLRHFPIPLPPLAEQNRIVDLVDVLMMLCDHIEEARITECKIQSRLLEVLLMETVQPMVQHAA